MQTNPTQAAIDLCIALNIPDHHAPTIQAAFANREARLVGALEDVANPLGYLQRKAEAEGAQLNGMAWQIANDPHVIKSIAKEALAALKDRTDG